MSNHVFVVGCPRSGTTLLRDLFTDHSDIAICPETHYFSTFVHKGAMSFLKKLWPIDTEDKLEKLSSLLKSEEIFGMLWIDWESQINMDKVIENFSKTDRRKRDLFDQLLKQYSMERGKSRAGEKTPSHLYHIDTLVKWFPECRIIHLLRDPRALLLSEMNKDVKPGYFLKKSHPLYGFGLFLWVAAGWWMALRLHERYKKRYPENYLLLKIEDVVQYPEKNIKEICDFINVEFKDEMLNLPIVNTSFQSDTKSDPIVRWKKLLPKKYVFLINIVLYKKLKKFGYEIEKIKSVLKNPVSEDI